MKSTCGIEYSWCMSHFQRSTQEKKMPKFLGFPEPLVRDHPRLFNAGLSARLQVDNRVGGFLDIQVIVHTIPGCYLLRLMIK